MENIYLFMIIALAILAIADLIVGVSNDAINFLNSAVGSKAISLRDLRHRGHGTYEYSRINDYCEGNAWQYLWLVPQDP